MMSDAYDVAIAGFGPTGASLAALLGRAGHKVLVIEPVPEVYQLPRAVHFDHEIMRIFQNLGLAEHVLPFTRAIDDCEFWTKDREVLVHVPTDRPTDQGWRSDYIFHQPSLEAELRAAAESHPSVEVALGSELCGFRETEDSLELEVRGPAGDTSLVPARWLVGCDGANSFVRRKAGLELEDLGFDEPWLVVDTRGDGNQHLPNSCIQYCDPARPTTLAPGARGFYRFELMLRPDETPEEMVKPERIEELLEAWLDPAEVEIVRAAVYRFHALVGHEWRRGRVALAGDAVHQMPPFLGQGMCSGIRDAVNLAWKLDRVLHGRSHAKLLDSYGREREPHVREFIERAVAAGRIICTQNPELARERDATLLARRAKGEELPLPTSLPCFREGILQPGPERHELVGRLAPQPRSGEMLLDDVTGDGFQLVLRDARGADADLTTLGGETFVWADDAGAAFFDRQGIHAFLARPDHAVFGVAREPGDVERLLGEATAALG